jgi:hypothetical protein
MNRTGSHCRNGIFCIALMVELIAQSGRVQDSRLERITVEDPRPVLQVLNPLEAKYGWQLTYEDPPYEASSDLLDVTDSQFTLEHPGRRRLFPAGRRLEFGFEVPITEFQRRKRSLPNCCEPML